jgi:DNA-binding NarL/FixJ family response regulator
MSQLDRAMIAAPPGLIRQSLRTVLDTFYRIELIGEADGCLSAQLMSQELKPDILLVAAGLPENEVTMLLQGFQNDGWHRPYTVVFVNTASQKQRMLLAGADAVLWQFDSTKQVANTLNQFQTTDSPLS